MASSDLDVIKKTFLDHHFDDFHFWWLDGVLIIIIMIFTAASSFFGYKYRQWMVLKSKYFLKLISELDSNRQFTRSARNWSNV